MNELTFLKEKILASKEELSQNLSAHSEEEQEQNPEMQKTVQEIRYEFIEIIADSLVDSEKTSEDRISDWAEKISNMAIEMGVPLEDTLRDTKIHRRIIWNRIRDIVREHNLSKDTIFEAGVKIDPVLDQAVYIFSFGYVKKHKETLDQAQEAFLELSAPIVPISETAAVLPLIGDIDSYRAKIIQTEILEKSFGYKLSHLVIDLSGVFIIDTMVAHEIIKIAQSLSLIGVETIITGIRPEIAQTMVKLGVDLEVKVKASLKQAVNDLYK